MRECGVISPLPVIFVTLKTRQKTQNKIGYAVSRGCYCGCVL